MKSQSFFTPGFLLKAIVYTNIALFIISLIYSGKNTFVSINPLNTLTPAENVLRFMGASGRLPIIQFQTWSSLVTANWLHGSLLHIVFNILALRTVVPLVIKEFGPFRMFSIYTLAGAGGFFLSFLGRVYLTIGASSGICGLIGALLFFGKSRGGQWGYLVYRQTSGWIISLGVIGFLMPNINNWGHLGGLLAGIFFAWIFDYSDRRKESLVDRILGIGFMALTALLLIVPVIQGFFLIFMS